MRSVPDCQLGKARPKVSRSLRVFKRELPGRLAAVTKALLGTGSIASGATLIGWPIARANSIT